jgi:hypothetical protein
MNPKIRRWHDAPLLTVFARQGTEKMQPFGVEQHQTW